MAKKNPKPSQRAVDSFARIWCRLNKWQEKHGEYLPKTGRDLQSSIRRASTELNNGRRQ